MKFKTLDDMDFKGKKVILRADFNVPLKNGKITDDNRIRQTIPTIKRISELGASQIIMMSHLGRPKGKVVSEFSLKPVRARLSELLEDDVFLTSDCVDITIPDNKYILLENLRFHPEERADNPLFAKKIASFADIYVNDCFGTSHRAHASLHQITKYLPGCAGLLLQKELDVLGGILNAPKRPFIAIIGGAKISGKINVIEHLLSKVDWLLLGGAMIFTFYKAKGFEVGKSLCEDESLDIAKKLLSHEKIILPQDVVVAGKIEAGTESMTIPVDKIPDDMIGLDIGEKTIEKYKKILSTSKTVLWNGPMGLFEIEDFAKATNSIARYLATIDAVTIIGGGDSASAIRNLGLSDKLTHISTGGGATLEFLEGKTLPAVLALEENMSLFSKF